MVAVGYTGAAGGEVMEVAVRIRYVVAGGYLFAAICMFVGLGLIYNLDKKSLAKMTEELNARKAK
jgi:GPH family glycoside/pentoside/hexuronide:cation symporter